MAKKIKLVRGQDLSFQIRWRNKTCNSPYYLEGFSSATLKMCNEDGTDIMIAGTLHPLDSSVLQFTLTDLDTSNLAIGEDQSFQVTFEQGIKKIIRIFENALDVQDQLNCAG